MPRTGNADLETKLAVLRFIAGALDFRKGLGEAKVKKIPGLIDALDDLESLFTRLLHETSEP
jgi:hypothetical protein